MVTLKRGIEGMGGLIDCLILYVPVCASLVVGEIKARRRLRAAVGVTARCATQLNQRLTLARSSK